MELTEKVRMAALFEPLFPEHPLRQVVEADRGVGDREVLKD